MPDVCTCGAGLPPDALFCHRCGKPQRDILPVQEQEVEVAAPAPQPHFERRAVKLAPGFRNPAAVRVGMAMAGIAAIVSTLFGVLMLVWFFAAAFAAPFAYNRRTGFPVSIREGARMGWIVGVFGCIMTVGLSVIGLLVSRNSWPELMREHLEGRSFTASDIEAALSIMQSPAALALLFGIICGILLLLCTAGGALGAKIAQKD